MLKIIFQVNNQRRLIKYAGIQINRSNLFLSAAAVSKRLEDKKKKAFKNMKQNTNVVSVWRNITVQQLSNTLNKTIDDVLEALCIAEEGNKARKPSSVIDDSKILQKVVKLCGARAAFVSAPDSHSTVEVNYDAIKRPPADPNIMKPRPPVVTIMGHVDHGKTTLLDTIRNSSIVDKEFGGITQHIGAFLVDIGHFLNNNCNEYICFLDTPGHAAFSAIRSRGAHVTDIIILVVAADDGIMKQTMESIALARRENVPLIVAINKIDKPNTNVNEVKRRLLDYGIQLEDFGGDVQSVAISALKGTNIDKLLEAIQVQAEILSIKGDYTGYAEGIVIESSMDPSRGKLATIIVQRGTLRKGSVLVAGTAHAKVRGMFNDLGYPVKEGTPGIPVEVIGWRELPSAGDEVLEVNSEKRAHEVIRYRHLQLTEAKQKEDFEHIQEKVQEHLKIYKAELLERRAQGRPRKRRGPKTKEIIEDDRLKFSIILKGDVDGSVDAILDVLDTYHSEVIHLDLIHYGVGPVTQSDIDMASLFNGVIYTFNTAVSDVLKGYARDKKIHVRNFNVIYNLINDIKSNLNERLPMIDKEEILGEANVLQEFLVSEGKLKVPVAGCRVNKGSLLKNAFYKVIRNQETLYQGDLSSMKHLKDEVSTIKKGQECGLKVPDSSIRFLPGDVFVCYKIVQVPQSIDWETDF